MIRILTDSASDILPAEAEQLGVTVIPLNVTLEDGTVLRDGVDMTPTVYYGVMARCHKLPTTSQPSPELFQRFFLEALPPGTKWWASSSPMSCPAPASAPGWPQTWPMWTMSSLWIPRTSAWARACWCGWLFSCGMPERLPGRSPPPLSTPRSICIWWLSSTT